MRARVRQLNFLIILIGLLWLPTSVFAQENRLALIIGNSGYKESPLANPQNDANDMADILEGLGFSVILRIDADRREMARAIREFGRELKQKRGVGLFYYAGHGMQIDNRNYLIPVNTPLEEEDEVPFESIDVGSVLAKMESAGNALNLLILDACRNNPFPRQFRSSSRGLARVEAPVGSLVVYSTAPGKVAADGNGRNGVFTAALLEELRTPGLSLTQTIRRTRAAVVKATGGRQVPWESSSLLQDYYFTEQLPQTTNAQKKTDKLDTPVQKAERDPDMVFWKSIQGSSSKAEYQAYLEQFPSGVFSALANARLDKLNSATSESTPSSTADTIDTTDKTELAIAELTLTPEQTETQDKTESIQIALVDTAQSQVKPASVEPDKPNVAALTVNVEPPSARVRIMNIVEKYRPGIQLDQSRAYDVFVTHPGYESYREFVTLDEEDKQLAVLLPKRDPTAPVTVPVPGGSFAMGCSRQDSLCESYEKPKHTVSVRSFSITRTEITVGQFSEFVSATNYRTDAQRNVGGNQGCYVWTEGGGISRTSAKWSWKKGTYWRDPGYKQKSSFPVSCVSWNDATAYAAWLSRTTGRSFSLPTEAEWEMAARAGASSAYGTDNKATSLCKRANVADLTLSPTGSKWSNRINCKDRYWFSAPVASYAPNALGVHDMQGNVWEWVQDSWAPNYNNTPTDGRAYQSAKANDHVLRGGAWESDNKRVRLSSRSKASKSSRTAMTGFRLVTH